MIVCSAFMSSGQSLPRLTFDDGVIHVSNLGTATTASITENGWQEILSVYTQEALLKHIEQPVAGRYSWNGNGILFEPTFPFLRGAIYHAVFSPDAFTNTTGIKIESLPKNLELVFDIPRLESPQSFIESIYPESAMVPENLLRMHINFSAPMMPGEAYDHVKLFNERGEQIDKAFLIIDQELWDKERKHFTILFDPGRIKRGLKANMDLGAPLIEGEKYYIVVDSTWRDANGNHLQNNFKKFLDVTTAQRKKITIEDLNVIAPSGDSRQALIIHFDRPMDHVLVSKYITVRNGLLETVAGDFQLKGDTTLRFIPKHNWKEGSYTVEISPLLEDVAGNNFNNAFDLDLTHDTRMNSTDPLTLEILIKASMP